MNESQFEQFIAECTESLRRKNAALERKYGLGTFARWDHDADSATLTFSNPGSDFVLEAATTDIGSYSLTTMTWMWAWANDSQTEVERAKASRIKQLFARTGMRLFSDPHFDCDEYLAWELAAASVHQLDSLGCYRGPMGHLWVFLSVDSVAVVRRAT
jgi:hypothetical protein